MKKLNIHLIAALLAVLMIFALHAAAFAVDTDYSGELDTETYEPLSESGISYNRTLISDTLSYDWNLGAGLSIVLMVFIVINMVVSALSDKKGEDR